MGRYKMKFALTSVVVAIIAVVFLIGAAAGEKGKEPVSSYSPVVIKENFATIMDRMKSEKPKVMARQMELLNKRYDLSDRKAKDVTMTKGKAVQEGVRAKLATGLTWEKIGAMSPEDIKAKGLWPAGFLPLPHPNHPEGGMLFPKFHIEEINKQEGRDLTRFDLDFDLPDHFLPVFPPPMYLTTRPDLGDVSKGKLLTIMNYYE